MLLYYCEVLERIRCVSVIVEKVGGKELTQWKVSMDKDRVLTVDVDGEQVEVPLPREVTMVSNAHLQKSVKKLMGSLVMRLPMDGMFLVDRDFSLLMNLGSTYKWDAKFLKLRKEYTIHCQACGNTVLDSRDVIAVNEMPSEIWAEMMDFWHCHKPHDDHVHEDKYSSLRPVKGGIIMASYYIAFHAADYTVKVRMEDGRCVCDCGEVLGLHDKGTGLDKLYKWKVVVHSAAGKRKEHYQVHDYIYCSLLDNVNGTATRVVEYVSGERHMLVWVFSASVSYRVTGDTAIQQGMKLYYTTDGAAIEQERRARGEFEVVDVDEDVFAGTLEHFESQRRLFPPSVRDMSTWRLALLSVVP